jgi:proline dehydrogenase
MTVSGVATRAKRAVLRRAGRAYLAGATLTDAVVEAEVVHGSGHAATLAYWNGEGDTPADVTRHATGMVDAAGVRASWCDVAVKVPALRYDQGAVARIAERCRSRGVRMWFDSHQPHTADRTLELAETAAALGCEVGVALPARWRRTAEDGLRAVDAGWAVRVVKGQFRDSDGEGHDVRHRFVELVDQLADRHSYVAVASHDEWVLEQACRRLARSTTPFEVQLLHGLPAAGALRVAAAGEVPVRIYAPFGHPSLVYSVRTMWENRRLAARFAEDLVLGGRSSSLLHPRR